MEYLENEFTIDTLGSIQLTNLRLYNWTDRHYQSMRLEHISYIGMSKQPRPGILKVGAFFCLALAIYGYAVNGMEGVQSAVVLCFFVMLVALLIYLFWMDSVLIFKSSGGAIISNMRNSDYFIDKVEAAIADKMNINLSK